MLYKEYSRLAEIYKEDEGKTVAIKYVELTEEEVRFAKLRSMMHYQHSETYDLEPGKYVKLIVNNQIVMSDTPMEQRTNLDFVRRAKGKVLIGGLGLGLIVLAIQKKPEVEKIVVLEKNQEVIDLVMKQLKGHLDMIKVCVDCKDVFEPDKIFVKGYKFDTIYFDIWSDICADNYPQMKELTKLYRKYRAKGGWLGCWRKEDCRERYYEDMGR